MYLRSWVQPVINPLQNFRGGGTVMCETCIAARIRRQRRDSSSTTCCKPCSFSRTQSCTSSCPGDHEVVLEFCRVHLEDFYPYTQGWLIRLGLLLIYLPIWLSRCPTTSGYNRCLAILLSGTQVVDIAQSHTIYKTADIRNETSF